MNCIAQRHSLQPQQCKDLAIVIPAFKITFLRQVLYSIANQIDKRFTVYIGDDCSPFDIMDVVKEFKYSFDLVYKRFDTNLGGNDLVAQWERCIALTRGEPYIWLFSDDDIMEPNCVEAFYKEKDKYPECDIFRFNVRIIDGNGEIIRWSKYPSLINSKNLYYGKIKGRLECFVVEYIFKRSAYERENGFEKFDLAWGSDLITWVKIGSKTGIRSLPTAFVSWRSSGINISTDVTPEILERKTKALIECLKWGIKRFPVKQTHRINEKGLVSRLAQTALHTNFIIGWKGIDSYSTNNFCRIKLYFLYTVYYLVKKIRYVF